MSELISRPRRLRGSSPLRQMMRETNLLPQHLIYPIFVKEGISGKVPIASMPGIFQLSVQEVVKEAKLAFDVGIKAILLFGIPSKKDQKASGAYAKEGVVQKAVREIKEACPELIVITDVCLCEYMSHGHCGLIDSKGNVLNDPTLELLAKTALSHVEAGADIVAPSDMMDGRVGAIRRTLDESNFTSIPIMSYAVKYASSFYGPFREAAESSPQFGDRKTYQMDYANAKEALKEACLDEEEGADFIIVKPAGAYLDIITRVSEATCLPVIGYQVSGEYSMIVAASEKGWLDLQNVIIESLTAIRRAGAQLVITYFAKEITSQL